MNEQSQPTAGPAAPDTPAPSKLWPIQTIVTVAGAAVAVVGAIAGGAWTLWSTALQTGISTARWALEDRDRTIARQRDELAKVSTDLSLARMNSSVDESNKLAREIRREGGTEERRVRVGEFTHLADGVMLGVVSLDADRRAAEISLSKNAVTSHKLVSHELFACTSFFDEKKRECHLYLGSIGSADGGLVFRFSCEVAICK